MGENAASLITSNVSTIITNFAAQIVPTVMDVLTIVVPVGLACWGIGFAIKKGIGYLQRRAGKAL